MPPLDCVPVSYPAEAPTAPILRWAGSKKRSLPAMAPFLPSSHGRYLEVFAGSACLFFYLAPERAVLADNNVELIRFYKTISQHPLAVYRRFSGISRNPKTYYEIRAKWFAERDPIKRAALFLYLNRNCFNGIYRTNSSGLFNVPFAKDRVQKYPTYDNVKDATNLLKRSTLYSADFEHVCVHHVRKNDFVYLDPPYYVPSKRVFREYSSEPFNLPDFKRLESTLRKIDRKGAQFLLSYPDCAEASRISKNWNSHRITVRRTIAGNVESRRRARELLIFNYDISHA